MGDYLLTHSGAVMPDWHDKNNHMNVVHYLSLFDFATSIFLQRVGLDETFMKKNNFTLVASRIYTSHKREMYAGDRFDILTGVVSISESQVVLTHRVRRGGINTSRCDIKMKPINALSRNSTSIPLSIIDQSQKYKISGLKDIFEDIA